MNILDLFRETYMALSANKARSGLTILGIVIGISSVIAMVSIGQGAQGSIETQITSMGSNLIMVMPGAQRGPGANVSSGRGSARTLTQADADAIKSEITDIKAVAPELSSRNQVTSKGKNTNTSIVGTTAAYANVRNVSVDNGSFITDQQVRSIAKVAVLGPTARDDLFGAGAEAVGQIIRIKNIEFTITGVTKTKGGSGFGNQDDMIFVPLSTAQRYFVGDTYVTTISIQAPDVASMTDIQQRITNLLLARHNITDPALADFNVLNQADMVSTVATITNTLTIFLAAVAGISLVVGGIGIMNMMLTTVTERTREIGLRKAIGAKRRDINLQFLMEAVMLTFIGGLVGVALGLFIAQVFTWLNIIQTKVSISSILMAFGVSATIGIVFGYYPARRAAALNPIDALRYE